MAELGLRLKTDWPACAEGSRTLLQQQHQQQSVWSNLQWPYEEQTKTVKHRDVKTLTQSHTAKLLSFQVWTLSDDTVFPPLQNEGRTGGEDFEFSSESLFPHSEDTSFLFHLQLTCSILLYSFQVYSIVVRYLYNLQSDSPPPHPSASCTHLAPHTAITVLLPICPTWCGRHL